jgi:hypothetical protein
MRVWRCDIGRPACRVRCRAHQPWPASGPAALRRLSSECLLVEASEFLSAVGGSGSAYVRFRCGQPGASGSLSATRLNERGRQLRAALLRFRREPTHESVTVPKLNVVAANELFGRFDGGGIVRVIVQEFDSSGIEMPVDADDIRAVVRHVAAPFDRRERKTLCHRMMPRAGR